MSKKVLSAYSLNKNVSKNQQKLSTLLLSLRKKLCRLKSRIVFAHSQMPKKRAFFSINLYIWAILF
jgi:hypothetical protein